MTRAQLLLGPAAALFLLACGMAALATSSSNGWTRSSLLLLPLAVGIWMCSLAVCAFRAAVREPLLRAIGTALIVAAMLALCVLLVVYANMLAR